jgi:hypothetical protein
MAKSNEAEVTVGQILFPLSLIGFVVMVSLAFQTSLIMRDRDALHDALTQQSKQLEDANKVQAQFSALALGTRKLAQGGDKDASALVDRMKKAGIVFQDETAAAPAPTVVPKP